MLKELEKELRKFIGGEAKKLTERYHLYHNHMASEWQRKSRVLTIVPQKVIRTPACWGKDRLFNPFYVQKHVAPIAHAIAGKIHDQTYSPHAPYIREIPKVGGGVREVCTYQIPDAAVSLWAYSNMLRKNRHRLSASSYAYRNDKNAHFAIQDMHVDFVRHKRLFVAEFDFSKFFDSIEHAFLLSQLNQNGFLFSDIDRLLINAFIGQRPCGVPQGTSISLFLANIACWWMDHELERIGVKFARYADDTVIWTTSYDSICRSFSVMEDFSRMSGVKINIKKSEGISLMTPNNINSELARSKEYVDFLGYNVSLERVSIKSNSIRNIKKHICHILHMTLIKPLDGGTWNTKRVDSSKNIDKDIGSAMHQIRRYLYGNLTETALKKFGRGMIQNIQFKGLMSYYPFVDDVSQLQTLDGWLANVITRFIHRRALLIDSIYSISTTAFPWNVTSCNVVEEFSHNRYLEIPSFLRIHNAIRRSLIYHGPFFQDTYSY